MPSNLSIIADNPIVLGELKALLVKQFEVSLNTNMPNELLGQVTRARMDGLNAVERALREIESHRTVSERENKGNPGA